MVAATVTEVIELFQPGQEQAILEVTDGETYLSRRLGTVKTAFATANVDDDGEVNCTISGQTVTINAAGMTDKKIVLLLTGFP